MEYEKIDKETALDVAQKALADNASHYLLDTLHAHYVEDRRFSDGCRKGWVISVRMNVPESFEPDLLFIEVSDPGGVVCIPGVL
ncbi:hypothetical protein [Leminorella grimontii]|uniref:hypothetical protein n=1 Tax=Leminorella grimontii TaxID=82981 RepID=UPI002086D902|nr:hypothetical protein [Leminorella grimontii]GKX59605.1 hypothetical protein SOASR031_19200 [Leminorella grimontii]